MAKRFTSALVPFVLALVRAGGADASKLEKKYLKVRAADGLALPEVTLDDLGALLADAAKVLRDPLFGFHAAMVMPRGSYGLLEFALRSAPTGRVAIEQLSKYGRLINPLVRWIVEVDGDEVALHHRAPKKGGVGRQGNIFTVARILQTSREMLGPQLNPTRAWFAHDEAQCPPELRAHLATDAITFGRSSNGIAFTARSLAPAPEGADAELNQALEVHAAALLEQVGAQDEVYEPARKAVLELLPKRGASLAKTARRLGMTARTLQRRLTAEEVKFSELVADVRRAQAERLLSRTDASIDDVAGQVGYGDTAAFVRAFKKLTGKTPGKFRSLA